MSRSLAGHPHLTPEALARLIGPNLISPISDAAYQRLGEYVSLLYRWNSKMNLTAVRDPQSLATLHLAECILAAQTLPQGVRTVLDFGSGAGLPGIPMAITRPEITVTLAEAHVRKAAFLREACRTLHLDNATVFQGRAESLTSHFDAVTLRAVDRMRQALPHARARVHASGRLVLLISATDRRRFEEELHDVDWMAPIPVPETSQRIVLFGEIDLR